MKKLLSGALVLAGAMAVQMGVSGTDASAATLAKANVTVNFATQTLQIAATSDAEVGFSVATVKANAFKQADGTKVTKNMIVPAADANWEWHDNTNAVNIDLSSLNSTKDNYIQVKGSSKTDPITIKIPAVPTSVKAVLDPYTAQVKMYETKKEADPAKPDKKISKDYEITSAIEYKTNYSKWGTYTATTDLTKYQFKGASLVFRTQAGANQAVSAIKTASTDIYDKEETPVEYYAMTSTYPGKEVKVAVKKLANGPAITVDYVGLTFTLPKNAEYRFNKPATVGKWADSPTPTAAYKLTNLDKIAANGILEVRVKGDAATKKAATKLTRVPFEAQTKLTVKNTALTGDVSKNTVGTALTVAYKEKKNAKGVVVGYSGIVITNSSTDAYQVIVDKPVEGKCAYSATVLPAADAKGAVAVLAGKADKSVNTTVACPDGSQIFVRRVGVAKTKTWSTPYIAVGTVKFPALP